MGFRDHTLGGGCVALAKHKDASDRDLCAVMNGPRRLGGPSCAAVFVFGKHKLLVGWLCVNKHLDICVKYTDAVFILPFNGTHAGKMPSSEFHGLESGNGC